MTRRIKHGAAVILVILAAVSALAAQGSPGLRIVTPVDGQIVLPGSTIDVRIDATAFQSIQQAAIITSLPEGVFPVQTLGASMTVPVIVPANAASGSYQLTAVATLLGGGQAESTPVTIRVAPSPSATRLLVNGFTGTLNYPGDEVMLEVLVDTGVDLRTVDGELLVFSSTNPAVATPNAEGLVTAHSSGTAKITIQYRQAAGNLNASVDVRVGGATRGDLNNDGRINEMDRVEVKSWTGHFATGPNDARDLNRDGLITAADVTIIETLCTETCVRRDSEPPAVACAQADGVWRAADVSLRCTAKDDGAGLTRSADLDFLLSTSVPPDTESSNAPTGVRSVCDVAGNCANAGPIGGNRIDKLAPSLILPPTQVAQQTEPGGARVNYPPATATDGGSGVSTTICQPGSGELFPLGNTNVTCTGVDAVGNSRSGSFTVTVNPAPTTLDGRMFGKGFIVDASRRHQHFLLRAAQKGAKDYARFEYWGRNPTDCADDRDDGNVGENDAEYGRGRRGLSFFEAVSIESVVFSEDPAFHPGGKKPQTTDSVTITGTGRWNGRAGHRFEVSATDRGEPGLNRDTLSIVIRDAAGAVVASATGTLAGGNIQSLRFRK